MRVKAALFSTIAVVLALTLIEVSVRLYYAIRSEATHTVDLHGYWVEDPDAGYSLRPGYGDGGIRINSLGFRGPETSLDKPDGIYRIAALGDSTTFGPREEECAYPFVLPRLLMPRQVEVINAGIEGYRTDRALIHLERDVLPLHPDLVTVFIGWNDLYQTDPYADSQDLMLQPSPLQRLLAWSATAQTFRHFYYEHPTIALDPLAPDYAARLRFAENYRPRGFGGRLHRIFESIRAAGADTMVFTWPTLLGPDMSPAEVARIQLPYHSRSLAELQAVYVDYQTVVRDVAAVDHVPVVDIAAAFDTVDMTMFFVDALHFTCAGHALVANRIASSIATRVNDQ